MILLKVIFCHLNFMKCVLAFCSIIAKSNTQIFFECDGYSFKKLEVSTHVAPSLLKVIFKFSLNVMISH